METTQLQTLTAQAGKAVETIPADQAEMALITAYLVVAAPGLRPTSRIQTGSRDHNCNGNCSHDEQRTYSDVRGVVVATVDRQQRERNGTTIDCDILFYTGAAGAPFAVGNKTGQTTRWQEGWSEWTMTLTPLTTEATLADWDVEGVVTGMTAILTARASEGAGHIQRQQTRLARIVTATEALRRPV